MGALTEELKAKGRGPRKKPPRNQYGCKGKLKTKKLISPKS